RPISARTLDALIIGGGDDIGAELYRGEVSVDVRIDPARDRLEQKLLREALRRGLPVLGICRGAQMINVVRGGALHEDIFKVYESAPRMRTVLPRKSVEIVAGSRLHRILRLTRCRVNALHHQSVSRLGSGLAIVARDDHGIVQAIEESAKRFLLGVQWHPEMLVLSRSQQRLFRALIAACR
ncbi:MAG: gamma-glutamyl-gamma-aminobutyrate hydrolase family protein, partial [Henriciella sp.]